MYYYGLGMKRDRTQGYFWLQNAATSGHPKAIMALNMLTDDTRVKLPH
jgi:TPR repeat protein